MSGRCFLYIFILTQPSSSEIQPPMPFHTSFFRHTHRHRHYTSAEPEIQLAPTPPHQSPTRHILFIYLPYLFSPYLKQAESISFYNIDQQAFPISPYRVMKQSVLTYNKTHIIPQYNLYQDMIKAI